MQTFPVYTNRFLAYFMLGSDSGNGLRFSLCAPERKILFQRPEQDAYGLTHGKYQVTRTVVHHPRLGSHKRLCQPESPGDGGNDKINFRSDMADFLGPDVLSEKVAAEASGKGELRGIRFPHPLGVKSAVHGIDQAADQQSFEFMAAINRCHQIKIVP